MSAVGLPFSPSLNQAVIADVPGLSPGIAGSRAGDWLSSMGMARRMAARGLAVDLGAVPAGAGMPAVLAAPPFPRRLDAMVADGRPEALALARQLGEALAALIATLALGPADARRARPDWPDSHWARWGSVRRLMLGGGLVSGALGQVMLRGAIDRLSGFGVHHVEVGIAEDPATLVLRGVAAGLPHGRAVLLDAGHTSVKPALADVVGGRGALRVASPVPASSIIELRAEALADRLADIAVAAAAGVQVRSFGLALATYTDQSGQPFPGQASAYASLAEVPLVERLSRRVETTLGPVVVRAGHDGSAAAAAVRGVADAAMVLGSAIGWGLNV